MWPRTRAQVRLNETDLERAQGLIKNQTITGRDLNQRHKPPYRSPVPSRPLRSLP